MEFGPVKSLPVELGSMLAEYGDRDPITNGGGRVYDTSLGVFFEYTEGMETDGDTLEVYRTHLGSDLCQQYAHLLTPGELEEMCECMDTDPGVWRRRARGKLSVRAQCLVDIANHFGWEAIDDEPLVLSPIELELRWYNCFDQEGPVTEEGCFDPAVIIPQMLLVLQVVSKTEYERLFKGRFPLIPSEALQNSLHPWWNQHGAEALQRLVEVMAKQAPQGYCFALEDGQYGFWATSGD